MADVTVTEASPVPAAQAPAAADPRAGRAELRDFLRSRRGRLAPEDVGLAPGIRRRTPGLRREEVAQLAGIGVTWYTWLEQGRPINASVQVLDAIARTLRLDGAERAHLYRLAGVPALPQPADGDELEPVVRTILDGLERLPAAVYNARYDLLAWNRMYAALFPRLTRARPGRRNALWHVFTAPDCCCQFINREVEMHGMVATLRGAFGRHVGDPVWTEFVERLAVASPAFARLWAGQDVADPSTRHKVYRHPTLGDLRLAVTSFALAAAPEARLTVYTPADDHSRDGVEWLSGHPDVPLCGHDHD